MQDHTARTLPRRPLHDVLFAEPRATRSVVLVAVRLVQPDLDRVWLLVADPLALAQVRLALPPDALRLDVVLLRSADVLVPEPDLDQHTVQRAPTHHDAVLLLEVVVGIPSLLNALTVSLMNVSQCRAQHSCFCRMYFPRRVSAGSTSPV